MTDLTAAACEWQAIDPDPTTRAEVAALLEAGDTEGLESRFGDRLTFGTAGLRGALGAGPNRMNRVVVLQTSAGLARFLATRGEHPSAVIGYDGRHNSAVFARDAAEALSAAGVAVTLLPRALPTPVLAFAVRDLGVSAGVMITASHNPAPDNGYKLYLGDADEGSQLVPPADGEVLAQIEAVVTEGGLPQRSSDGVTVAGDDVLERYVTATARLAHGVGGAFPWVYTPLHGVGLETVTRVLEAAGLPAPAVVAVQAETDPDFPTAAFPNPEEPGTLDPSFATARETGARLVLANDPDADRLALALPDAASPDGWRRLTGNQVGLLLAWLVGQEAEAGAGGTFACSIVSSPGLARIADRFGFASVETLTGFKWISRAPGLRFGFEEALGYLVDAQTVRDKDGISALVVLLAAALRLDAEGRTIADLLGEIEAAIGRFDSDQISLRVDDLARIDTIMQRLRAKTPDAIGGVAVVGADDLSATPSGTSGSAGNLPPSDVLRYRLEDGSRVIVRPSGTEPKLKVYLDVHSDAADAATRHAETDAALEALRGGVHRLLDAQH